MPAFLSHLRQQFYQYLPIFVSIQCLFNFLHFYSIINIPHIFLCSFNFHVLSSPESIFLFNISPIFNDRPFNECKNCFSSGLSSLIVKLIENKNICKNSCSRTIGSQSPIAEKRFPMIFSLLFCPFFKNCYRRLMVEMWTHDHTRNTICCPRRQTEPNTKPI